MLGIVTVSQELNPSVNEEKVFEGLQMSVRVVDGLTKDLKLREFEKGEGRIG